LLDNQPANLNFIRLWGERQAQMDMLKSVGGLKFTMGEFSLAIGFRFDQQV
jgi:hypothetical protein